MNNEDTARDDSNAGEVETPGGPVDRFVAFWHRIREPRWARWLIDIGIFAAIFFAITAFQTRNLVDDGRQVPELTLESTDGTSEPLVDPKADRTLVYFWAPWCGVCDVEAGTVDWARSLMGEDVAIRTVVFDYESASHAKESARAKEIASPVLLGNRRVQKTFRIDAFPTFYVLSNDGRVLSSTKGYTTTLGLLWRAWF